MSNARRLKGSRAARPRCGACGGGISQAQLARSKTLVDGRIICGRCIDSGILCQRLPCGHYGVPGMTVVADSSDLGNFSCPRCTPYADDKQVLGVAERAILARRFG